MTQGIYKGKKQVKHEGQTFKPNKPFEIEAHVLQRLRAQDKNFEVYVPESTVDKAAKQAAKEAKETEETNASTDATETSESAEEETQEESALSKQNVNQG